MTETGWPLIPREALPAPVPAAKIKLAHRPSEHPDAGRQLSIFGAETTEPSPADLAGLLAGPARLGRMGGTARVSVQVDAAWRVHVLVAELVRRGLVVNWLPIEQNQDFVRAKAFPDADISVDDFDGTSSPPADAGQGDAGPAAPADRAEGEQADTDQSATDFEGPRQPDVEPPPRPLFEVRTAYSTRLIGLARAWPAAAAQLFLSGPRLRLWVAAAGEPLTGGYALGLAPATDGRIIDAALVRAGLAGHVSDDGRHYLIMGKRRLARLAELVGERPAAAPARLWPGGAPA